MKLQGDGHPLILAQPPVIVGLQEGQLVGLIEGVLLQVQAGGVDVGSADVGPLAQALLADDRQHNGLAPVHPVDLVPGLQLLAPDQRPEPGVLRQGNGTVHALTLSLACVQKLLIAGAVGLHCLILPVQQTVITVLPVIEQGTAQLLSPAQFLKIVHEKNLL